MKRDWHSETNSSDFYFATAKGQYWLAGCEADIRKKEFLQEAIRLLRVFEEYERELVTPIEKNEAGKSLLLSGVWTIARFLPWHEVEQFTTSFAVRTTPNVWLKSQYIYMFHETRAVRGLAAMTLEGIMREDAKICGLTSICEAVSLGHFPIGEANAAETMANFLIELEDLNLTAQKIHQEAEKLAKKRDSSKE